MRIPKLYNGRNKTFFFVNWEEYRISTNVLPAALSVPTEAYRRGDFSALKKWLNERIHRHGQRWRAAELCRRVTGRELGPRPLVQYLRQKFSVLYGV